MALPLPSRRGMPPHQDVLLWYQVQRRARRRGPGFAAVRVPMDLEEIREQEGSDPFGPLRGLWRSVRRRKWAVSRQRRLKPPSMPLIATVRAIAVSEIIDYNPAPVPGPVVSRRSALEAFYSSRVDLTAAAAVQ